MADTRPIAVLDRLMEDDYLQEQLSAGAGRLQAAYKRARAVRKEQAVKDQRLYEHVRGAVESLSEAARRAAGKPKPQPKRRWRRLGVLLVAVAVGALVWRMHSVQQSAAAEPSS
jgi:ferric-dicitrate binding protein FerR (iron transport regulator)